MSEANNNERKICGIAYTFEKHAHFEENEC